MEARPLILLGLFATGCSVPGVGTITIKNESNFPVAAEYSMSKSDGNKKGRVVTPPKDHKNHDFTYKHAPLDETTDNGKQELSFYLTGKFFHYLSDQPAHRLNQIRYRGGSIDAEVEIDPETLKNLKDNEIPFAFNKVDNRLLVYPEEDGGSSIYIAAGNDTEELNFGTTDDEHNGWAYEAMTLTSEIYLNKKSGHNVVEKTYICDLDRCRAE